MTLAPGTRLGPYEISAQIGVGGMGEVYRAHDARLRRDVAIKTSAARFSERFEREARTIAALNHPNICTLHDIGPDYLVMELVEGASPAGPLPVDEVLHIAAQVAAALEAAHERGIVHRDLKPANVKITPGGVLKVLDFGLAKVLHDPSDATATVTLGVTQAGTALGTPAYMAPEQAQGKDVDKRADVWAFGVMLFELLTGERPFRADSVQSTLVAVLTQEPDWSRVPARFQRLLRACLKKDPRERLSGIGNWRLLLDDDAPVSAAPARRRVWPWAVAALALAIGVLAAVSGLRRSAPVGDAPRAVRFQVPIPGGLDSSALLALSPDAQHLAVSALEDGQIRLRVRKLDTLDTRLLPGAEGARYQFWKPDGSEIAFFADGKMKTIPLAGGPPTIVTDVDATVAGATWSPQGTIVFSQARELYTVSAKGGTPALLYSGPGVASGPKFLPDGQHFLYQDSGVLFIGALDGSPPVKVLENVGDAQYADGHLLYRKQGRLFARAFDAATLTPAGDEIPITSENLSPITSGSFSLAGAVLAYQAETLEQLVWKDRTGGETAKVGEPRRWQNFRLSPDQSRIALVIFSQGVDVALFDVHRGTLERYTSHPSGDLVPVFSPDGTQLAFSSFRDGRFNPFVTRAPSQERRVADVGTSGGFPTHWSPDGKALLYWGDEDLWIVPLDGARPYTFAQSKADERDGMFSPDGRWIAYVSNESGRYEVVVQSFPEQGGRRYPVSSQGGLNPAWRRDGKELFYVAGDGRLTAVPVTLRGSSLELGRAESLFPVTPGQIFRLYEPSPDGQRFLMTTPAAGAAITVLLNWRRIVEP